MNQPEEDTPTPVQRRWVDSDSEVVLASDCDALVVRLFEERTRVFAAVQWAATLQNRAERAECELVAERKKVEVIERTLALSEKVAGHDELEPFTLVHSIEKLVARAERAEAELAEMKNIAERAQAEMANWAGIAGDNAGLVEVLKAEIKALRAGIWNLKYPALPG